LDRIEELMERAPGSIVVHRAGPSGERAFTLIELLIAVTLSATIIYTAFAAFRVVGQSVAISNRMSIENNLLRTGFFAALNELDFWDLYDDRHSANPAANPLRIAGKPFAPLKYDKYQKPNDPCTWWRGFGFAKTAGGTSKWGNFAELSREGHTDAGRAWYPNQIKVMNDKLGVYGSLSYLPGNAIFSWYDSSAMPFKIKGLGVYTDINTPEIKWMPQDIWERTSFDPIAANSKAFDKGERGNLLPSHPAHWPGLAVEARRYIVWSSFIDLCQVEMTSPITGESTRLSFWGVGTSLRGARQQRSRPTDDQKLDTYPSLFPVPVPVQ